MNDLTLTDVKESLGCCTMASSRHWQYKLTRIDYFHNLEVECWRCSHQCYKSSDWWVEKQVYKIKSYTDKGVFRGFNCNELAGYIGMDSLEIMKVPNKSIMKETEIYMDCYIAACKKHMMQEESQAKKTNIKCSKKDDKNNKTITTKSTKTKFVFVGV